VPEVIMDRPALTAWLLLFACSTVHHFTSRSFAAPVNSNQSISTTVESQKGQVITVVDIIRSFSRRVIQLYNEANYAEATELAVWTLLFSKQELGNDHPETATCLDNLAAIHQAMDKFDLALKLGNEALTIRQNVLGEHDETATSLNNLSALLYRMGRYKEALERGHQALAMREIILGPEHRNTATTLDNLAMIHSELGQYDEALPIAERALGIFLKLDPKHDDTAKSLDNLSSLYRVLGQYEQGLPLVQQALAVWQEIRGPEHPDTAKSMDALATHYEAMGKYDQAIALREQARNIFEKALGPNHLDTAATLNGLATLYRRRGLYEQALAMAQRALDIRYKTLGLEHEHTASSLNTLASVYLSMGEYNKVMPLARKAFSIAFAADLPGPLQWAAADLGFLYKEFGNPSAAIFYYKISVNASEKLRGGAKGLRQEVQQALVESLVPTYRILADLLIQEGRLTEAEEVLAMLKQQEHFEFVRGGPNNARGSAQATFLVNEQILAEGLLEVARAQALAYTELEMLDKQEQNLGKEVTEKRNKLRERLVFEGQRFDRQAKEVEHQLVISKRSDHARQLIALSNTVAELRNALGTLKQRTGRTAAVVYFLPSENSTTFLVSTENDAFSVHAGVGEKQLDELVLSLRQAIMKKDASYRHYSQDLHQALIKPIESRLKSAKVDTIMLYLVDTLRYLPFAALFDAVEGKHLAEKYTLSMYTAAALTSLEEMSKEMWSAAAAGVTREYAPFHALSSVDDELKRIVRVSQEESPPGILPGIRYLDEKFTRQQFIDLLEGRGGYSVVHLATHFKVTGREEQSFLLLGDGRQFTLQEIRTYKRSNLRVYDLVTLSACETALGSGYKGVEVESLGVMLQNKGAKSVLATLWDVQDEGTARFMEEFYRARGERRKTTKAEALQEAQLALLQGRVKSDNVNINLTHPYYWAPFVLMGNWM
jgi:CHAT domain-containing protein